MRTCAGHFVKMTVEQISTMVVAMLSLNLTFEYLSRPMQPMRLAALSLLFANSGSSVYLRSAKAVKQWMVDWGLMRILN